jgi:Domain of unknown function (DUF4158)
VQLLAFPTGLRELEERYGFTPSDLEFIGAHRTNSNRLGIAVQLCFLRHPGLAWTPEERIPATDCCSCSSSLGTIDNRGSISCSAEGLSRAERRPDV